MSYNLEQINSGYVCLNAAGLAEGTNANTYQFTNNVNYTSNGVFKTKTATDNVAFTAGIGTVPPSSAALYAVWIDADGNLSNTRGPVAEAGAPCPLPTAAANNVTLLGLIKVTTNESVTFTPGSTDLGNANVTDVFYDCMAMPGTAL